MKLLYSRVMLAQSFVNHLSKKIVQRACTSGFGHLQQYMAAVKIKFFRTLQIVTHAGYWSSFVVTIN